MLKKLSRPFYGKNARRKNIVDFIKEAEELGELASVRVDIQVNTDVKSKKKTGGQSKKKKSESHKEE